MKLCALLLLASAVAGMADNLADYRWKKRLLVVTEGSMELAAASVVSKDGLIERDVEVFVLKGPKGSGKVPAEPLAREIRGRLKIRNDFPEVILLGKDGRTILRWPEAKFTMAVLFGSIDEMPMRKQEVRSK